MHLNLTVPLVIIHQFSSAIVLAETFYLPLLSAWQNTEIASCNSLIGSYISTQSHEQTVFFPGLWTNHKIGERLPQGLVHTVLKGWYLITSSYPMNGQNKLANNDWYVFKTEPRADAVVRRKTAADSLCTTFSKIRLELFHTVSLLKGNCPVFLFSTDEAHF